jgi:hypothetical protein
MTAFLDNARMNNLYFDISRNNSKIKVSDTQSDMEHEVLRVN